MPVKTWKLKDGREFFLHKYECGCCHTVVKQLEYVGSSGNLPGEFWRHPTNGKHYCMTCVKRYSINDPHGRGYGFRRSPSCKTTIRDKSATEILGLEMEFEGNFTKWKELEIAHGGQLQYGYDTSVSGENELSWDCGSFTWWKYVSNLRQVCKILKQGGASAGPTAGIHIHVSKPNAIRSTTTLATMASRLNNLATSSLFAELFTTVGERQFNRYCDPMASYDDHHAAISYSTRHQTLEFRFFSSTLDTDKILSRLLFVKEIFNLVHHKVPDEAIIPSLSKQTKTWVLKEFGSKISADLKKKLTEIAPVKKKKPVVVKEKVLPSIREAISLSPLEMERIVRSYQTVTMAVPDAVLVADENPEDLVNPF